MVTRRELLGAGMAAVGAPDTSAETREVQADVLVARQLQDVARSLERVVDELQEANSGCSTGRCVATSKIREAMTLFARANAKFPDLIEVGPGVFFEVYDWHVRNRQPLSVGRGGDGRYGLVYLFTRLILRTDAQPDFVGVPYDVRA